MSEAAGAPIRVKILSRDAPENWARQCPAGPVARWGRCEFVLDAESRDYDWLVVYDDLPPRAGERRSQRVEALACPRSQTLLVTTEPSSIKSYGRAYTAQFGWVLTSQPAWALPHPGRLHSQPALRWFYGVGGAAPIGLDTLRAYPPETKTRDLSMVWSGKRERHTAHRRRHDFMVRLREALPEMDVYGRGVRELHDKAEALADYRYHIAIENHIGRHHWTEKLADPLLGLSLPFYYGCPNAGDYFPEDAFIRIDIDDFEGSLATIRRAIAEDAWGRRLPALREARRRVLEEYNFVATVAALIEARHPGAGLPGGLLRSRHALRRRAPVQRLVQGLEKGWARLRTRLGAEG